ILYICLFIHPPIVIFFTPYVHRNFRPLPSFPTRRSSDLMTASSGWPGPLPTWTAASPSSPTTWRRPSSTASRTTSPPEGGAPTRSEERRVGKEGRTRCATNEHKNKRDKDTR